MYSILKVAHHLTLKQMFIYIKSSENLCPIIYYILLYIPKRKKYIKKEKGLKKKGQED